MCSNKTQKNQKLFAINTYCFNEKEIINNNLMIQGTKHENRSEMQQT